MNLVLLFLLTINPQHKQLVNMVKQGDMFAADELSRSLCGLDGSERTKATNEVRRRVRKVKGKAADMLRQELDRCSPAQQDTSDQAQDSKPNKSAKEKPKTGRRPEPQARGHRPLLLGDVEEDNKAAAHDDSTQRKPVTAEPKAQPVSNRAPESDDEKAVAAPKPTVARTSPLAADENLPELAPIAQERPVRPLSNGLARPQALGGNRETLRDALFYYGAGGGFVAASSMTYLLAAASVGWGVFETVTLPPVTNPEQKTNGGRTLQQVRDDQITATWLQAGGLAFASVVVATGSLVAGMVLMGEGSEAVDAY